MTDLVPSNAEFLLYQTEDGRTRVEVRFDGETAWLSLDQMAELFQRDKSVISRHVKNIFDERELDRRAVVADFAITALDKKSFALDDARLKRAGAGNYFDELLARIRDVRSSEKLFWRKVLDIYGTSIDYDPQEKASLLFFKTVQNKMHWAAHGHTAAEIIAERADSNRRSEPKADVHARLDLEARRFPQALGSRSSPSRG